MNKKPRTERFELLLDQAEKKTLRDLAKKSGLSCADVLRQLIRNANVSSVIR